MRLETGSPPGLGGTAARAPTPDRSLLEVRGIPEKEGFERLVRGHDQGIGQQSTQTRRHLRGIQRQFSEQEPDWPMWPDAGGFLPWATSIDGDNIGWWAVGPPESWGTRYYGRDSDHFEMSGGVCEFLVQLLRGELIEFADDALPAQVFVFERDPNRPPPPEPWIQLSIDFDRVPRQTDRLTNGATAVFEDWATPARAAGLRIDPLGWHRELDEQELRPMFRIHFPPELADLAKSMIVDLAHRFGVGVRDVRDDEYFRWWPELST